MFKLAHGKTTVRVPQTVKKNVVAFCVCLSLQTDASPFSFFFARQPQIGKNSTAPFVPSHITHYVAFVASGNLPQANTTRIKRFRGGTLLVQVSLVVTCTTHQSEWPLAPLAIMMKPSNLS